MKNKIKNIFILFIMCTLFLVTGCKKKTTSINTTKKVYNLNLNANKFDILVFDEYQLEVLNNEDSLEIIWTSSDESICTVKDGLCIGISEGKAEIKAKVGDKELTCTATILSSDCIPYIELSLIEDEINIIKDNEFIFNPFISYNGKVYNDASYTLFLNKDGVNVNGLAVKGIVSGNYEITIEASWRGYKDTISLTIPLNVVDDEFIVLNERNIDIYTSKCNGHKISHLLDASYYQDGVLKEKDFTWSIVEGFEYVSIENNQVISKKEGIAKIIGKTTNDKNKVILSPIITVNVLITSINVLEEVFVELNGENLVDITTPFNKEIEKIEDNGVDVCYNKLTKSISNGIFGERKWSVYSKDDEGLDIKLLYNVKVATLVIETPDDLSRLYEGISSKEDGNVYTGYIVVANDIDATGYSYICPSSNWSGTYDGGGRAQEGFQGTFDGCGHVIYNLVLAEAVPASTNGIFGTIGQNGVVKNIAFVNISNSCPNKKSWNPVIICQNLFGGTLENVLITTEDTFFAPILYTTAQSRIKNVVAFGDSYEFASFSHMIDSGVTGSNVLVIGNKSTVCASSSNTTDIVTFDISNYLEDVRYLSTDFSKLFPENIWDSKISDIPLFNSMKKEYSVSLSKGVTLDLSQFGTFERIEADVPSGVSLENGIVSVLNPITSSFKVYCYNGPYNFKTIVNVDVIDAEAINGVFYLDQNKGSDSYFDTEIQNFEIDEIKLGSIILSSDNYRIESSKIYIDEDYIKTLSCGPLKVIIKSNEKYYIIDSLVVSKYITTAQELENMWNYLEKVELSKASSYGDAVSILSFDGYLVIGADIDASGIKLESPHANWTGSRASIGRENEGFHGIFDGQGHTITGLTVTGTKRISQAVNFGIFGTIGRDGIVKNISFRNVKFESGNAAWMLGGLACNVITGSIENVYFSTNDSINSTIGYIACASIKNITSFTGGTSKGNVGDFSTITDFGGGESISGSSIISNITTYGSLNVSIIHSHLDACVNASGEAYYNGSTYNTNLIAQELHEYSNSSATEQEVYLSFKH